MPILTYNYVIGYIVMINYPWECLSMIYLKIVNNYFREDKTNGVECLSIKY